MAQDVKKKPHLYQYEPPQLRQILEEVGIKGFKKGEVLKWLYEHKVDSFSEMTTLSKEERRLLESHFDLTPFEVKKDETSPEGTKKILYELRDGRYVESVLIPNPKGYTICVSTEVGCPVGCVFCASGMMGLRRNLETEEIVGQFLASARRTEERISNVVIMGMGEPFLNFENVIEAIKIFHSEEALAIGLRRITLSTVGLKEFMEKIFTVSIRPRLAISLHAPNDELRRELIPFDRIMTVDEIKDFIRRYTRDQWGKVTLEYVLIQGKNSNPAEAHELGRRFRDLPVKVNLIPYNYVDDLTFEEPTSQETDRFAEIVNSYGLVVTVRGRHGDSIDAACGQLRLKERKKAKQK